MPTWKVSPSSTERSVAKTARRAEKQREYSRRYLEDPEHREANRRRASAHYYANREDRVAKVKRYYETNRELVLAKLGARKYGLTVDEYLELMTGARCAVCGSAESLGVDHDHETRKVRGVLCVNCNFLIGHGKDNPTLLRLAADYLEGTR